MTTGSAAVPLSRLPIVGGVSAAYCPVSMRTSSPGSRSYRASTAAKDGRGTSGAKPVLSAEPDADVNTPLEIESSLT